MLLTAQDFDDLYHLGSVAVTYTPRSINTEAIQVSSDNIGALSVELRQDLLYYDDGKPYFICGMKRDNAEEPHKAPVYLYVRLTDWIVVLWDQIHIFRDYEFKTTFSFPSKTTLPAHQLSGLKKIVEEKGQDLERVQRGSLAFDHDEVNPR